MNHGNMGNDEYGYNWNRENFKDRKKFKNKDKVTICHKFNRGGEDAVTINVSANAANAELSAHAADTELSAHAADTELSAHAANAAHGRTAESVHAISANAFNSAPAAAAELPRARSDHAAVSERSVAFHAVTDGVSVPPKQQHTQQRCETGGMDTFRTEVSALRRSP